ncbi:MAG TPA: S8/S53 family peptidase [Thermoanaerobaculia bacterium]
MATKKRILGSVLRYPHFESFAVEWQGTQDELAELARGTLGAEWRVEPLAGDDFEIFNPAHLKSGWEPVRTVAAVDPLERPPTEIPTAEAWELARTIRKDPRATFVEPLFATYAPAPDEPVMTASLSGGSGGGIAGALNDFEWPLKNARVLDAWALTGNPGEGIRIAHPDTGYQIHSELDAAGLDLTHDIDLMDGDDDALDPLVSGGLLQSPGHGTSTGSVIISSRGTVGRFVSGVAPHAKLVPIRTSTSVVLLSMRNLVRALDHAVATQCHVVSISMGGTGSYALDKAVRRAVSAGLIVVAAAGNKVRFVVDPGAHPDVVCVAASNFDDKPWSGTCRGGAVSISAPGETVWRARVAYRNGKVETDVEHSSGSSYGTAIVAGVAALWLSHHGRDALIQRLGDAALLASTFKAIVRGTARKPSGWKTGSFGRGIVDAKGVLEADPVAFAPAGLSTAGAETPANSVRRRLTTIAGVSRPEAMSMVASIGLLAGAATGDLEPVFADLGPEIAFLAATDPAVQKALRQSAKPQAGAAAGAVDTRLRDALADRKEQLSRTAVDALQL